MASRLRRAAAGDPAADHSPARGDPRDGIDLRRTERERGCRGGLSRRTVVGGDPGHRLHGRARRRIPLVPDRCRARRIRRPGRGNRL